MRKNLLAIVAVFAFTALFTNTTKAQGTLIHYWHFNNFTSVIHEVDSPIILDADFSIHDTSKARLWYRPIPTATMGYPSYADFYTALSTDNDTMNLRMGQPSGNAFRARNPYDSMELLLYIPSVHYHHLVFKYGTMRSGSGPQVQQLAYSVDSGMTWRTSALSTTYDSVQATFNLVTVTFTSDSQVNNCSGLVFKITVDSTTASAGGGNNRYDNFTLDGDSILAPSIVGTISIADTVGTTICAGTSVHFTSSDSTSPGVTPYYQWMIDGTLVGSDSAGFTTNALVTGDTVKCLLYNGSTSGTLLSTSNFIVFTVLPLPVAGSISGANSFCVGAHDSLTETVSTGFWTATNGHATISSTGWETGVSGGVDTIKYSVTNSCGTAVATEVVTVHATIVGSPITGSDTLCQATSVSLHDSVSGGVWSITNGHGIISATGVVTGISGGMDTVHYLISSSCASSMLAIVVNPRADSGSITGLSSLCVGDNDTLTESVTGGVWSITNTAVATLDTIGIATAVGVGTDTIYYTVTNVCGSTKARKIINITLGATAAPLMGDSVVCAGSSLMLTDSTAAGVWSIVNGHASVNDSGKVMGISMGRDTVKYVVTFTCGIATETKVITVNPLPVAGMITGGSSVCAGTTLTLTDTTATGTWAATNSNATVAAGVVTAVTAGTDSVMYSVSNSCGTAMTAVGITINPQPVAGMITAVSDSLCPGAMDTLTDTVSGGVWSTSNTSIATITTTGIVGGVIPGVDTISYTVTNVCGTATATFVAAVRDSFNVCFNAVTGPGSVKAYQINIFPNPTNSSFTIDLPANSYNMSVTFVDIYGKNVVIRETSRNGNGQRSYSVDGIADGTYFIKAVSGTSYYYGKVIVLNNN